ncbi:MAG: phosphodiester glycosidase family protein [Acidobacteria bacterium]|nr:phosphodiester glycosidase family protein [Acidobacteriota bacterium]
MSPRLSRVAFTLALSASLVLPLTRVASASARRLVALPAPTNLKPFVLPGTASEGVYHPVGRTVQGHHAIYVTLIRPLDNPTTVAGVAYIDTHLLTGELYSGSLSPGGLFWKRTAPVSRAASKTLVAAFSGGFLMKDSHGGYFSEGHLVAPLVNGAASLVIFKNGTMTVGQWGRDVTMSPAVAAVRQNLTLLVDHGAPVAGLQRTDVARWGFSLNNQIDTPRSALGITRNGALVYVEGEMNIVDLARILVRAGALRAMVLDMNPLWPIFAYYTPASPTGYAVPSNGQDLTPTMQQTPARFFQTAYARDFITLSAAA